MLKDYNQNGLVDAIEQQLQHVSSSTLANYATIAKKASEIEDGGNKCFFNNVNKSLVLKYGSKSLSDCIQFGARDNFINGVQNIGFKNNTTLNGLIDDLNAELTEEQAKTYTPSVNAVKKELANIGLVINYDSVYAPINHNHDSAYAPINHNHDSAYAPINHNHDSAYAPVNHSHNSTYAAIVHNHDERYALLNNIVSEIQAIASNNDNNLIPSVSAVRSYCADYLQNYANFTSAFDIWKSMQPPREPDYTIDDFMQEVQGPKGDKGDKGDTGATGLSAYDIWLAANNYNSENYSIQDFLNSLKGDKGDDVYQTWLTTNNYDSSNHPIEEFLLTIQGPRGEKGDKGDKGDTGSIGEPGLNAYEIWLAANHFDPEFYSVQDFLNSLKGEKGDKGDTGASGQDAEGKSWWDYLSSYGLTAASAAQSIAGDYATANALSALQGQVLVIEGQVASILGGETAEAFADAMSDAASATLTPGQYAGNIFQNVANGFRALGNGFSRARTGATNAAHALRASMNGYIHLTP